MFRADIVSSRHEADVAPKLVSDRGDTVEAFVFGTAEEIDGNVGAAVRWNR